MDFLKFSKFLFFSFLFFLPFQTVYLLREPMIDGEKWQYGTIGLYGTDILLLVAIVSAVIASRFWEKIEDLRLTIFESEDWISRLFILKSKIINHKSTIALVLLILWSGLSIFWAADQMLAGYFFVKLLLAAGVFFLVRSLDATGVKMSVKILLAAAVIQSILGIGQFAAQNTFSSSLLGMSAHESWQAGTSVLKLDGERWLRAYGSFPHPNMLGGFLSAVLVLSIGFRLLRTKMQDAGCKMQDRISFIVYHASLILILLGLILTFSRTAWLGAVIGIVVLAVMAYRRMDAERENFFRSDQKPECIIIPRPWNYDTCFRILGVLGVATVAFVFILRGEVFPRFDGAAIVREGSVSERVQSFRDARTIIGEGNVLLGVGAGNFTDEVMRLEPDRPVWSVQPAHNVLVLVFAELGAVGLLLFVGFFLSVIASAAKQSDNKNDDFRFSIFEKGFRASLLQSKIFNRNSAILLALLPSLLLDHWLWSSHFGLLFFFLFVGFVSRKD